MVQYVITPWRNQNELLKVRQQLYSASRTIDDGSTAKRYAVEKVSVWMQRGNCPHLIESTAILSAARLNDVPGNSNYCIRAAYAAAFSRFVTGLLDSHQDKRRKLSMYSIAKTIGLPATFVELRHQATHEELPSLPKLRNATDKALLWIWEYYWAQLSEKSSTSSVDCKPRVERLLKEKHLYTEEEFQERLNMWGRDQLREAVMEISRTTSDADVLWESLRLNQVFLLGSQEENEDSTSEAEQEESEIRDIDAIRSQLARMKEILPNSETGDPLVEELARDEDENAGGRGWVLWEGPWTPKPIGTIS